MWDVIKELVSEGTTLLLTTQYMEEADQLAHRIAVIDGGHVIAEGTAEELKNRVGGELLSFRVPDRTRVETATGVIERLELGSAHVDGETGEVTLPVGGDGTSVLTELVRQFDGAGVAIADLALRRPTLDDVFLALTGHGTDDQDGEQPAARRGRRSRRRAGAPS